MTAVAVSMWCVKACVVSENGWQLSEAIYGGEFNEGGRRSSEGKCKPVVSELRPLNGWGVIQLGFANDSYLGRRACSVTK